MHNSALFKRMKSGLACGTLAVIIVAATSHARSAGSAAEELPLLGNPLGDRLSTEPVRTITY